MYANAPAVLAPPAIFFSKKEALLDFPISTGSYEQLLSQLIRMAQTGKSAVVCVANVHMFVEAHRNRDFKEIMNGADIVTTDGKPLTWGLKILYGIKQDRVAGMDLMPDLLSQLCDDKLSVFFYGGTQEMLARTKDFCNEKFPALNVAGMYSPPFRKLTAEEDQDVVDMINRSGASIVWVALGCPKQERWMISMKGRINALMIGIGGALPVMVGMQKRAPLWMQNAGLEWLYRLCQEPKRLFKRYAVTNSMFILLLAKALVKMKVFRMDLKSRQFG